MIQSGLAFVVSNIEVDGDLPVEVLPGHVFRRASDEEIAEINRVISESSNRQFFSWIRYDALVKEVRQEGNTNYHFEDLPREQWRYWVIAFEGQNRRVHDVDLLALLLPTDFDLGFQLYYDGLLQSGKRVGYMQMPLHYVEKYGSTEEIFKNARRISTKQLESITELHSLFEALPEDYSFVRHAISNFSALRRIPRTSELLTVGYFSIIESLITHAPRLSETLDSINHQITNKMILLRKKFTRQILPTTYFMHAAEERLWKKLYAYRSSLAHGNKLDFNQEFQVLKGHAEVIAFLKENIKELLVLALKDPEFLSDLRRC